MKRRNFIQLSKHVGVGLSTPMTGFLISCAEHSEHSLEFKTQTFDLLKDWCDEMIKVQINNSSNVKKQVHINHIIY